MLRLLLVVVLALGLRAAGAQNRAQPIDLLATKPANYGMRIEQFGGGYRLTNTREAEKHASLGFSIDVDLRAHPEVGIDVPVVGPNTIWSLAFDPAKGSDVARFDCLPHTRICGSWRFPVIESVGPKRLQGTLWLYVQGPVGASIMLRGLALPADGAAGVPAHVWVDASAPRQVVDGLGGQADYSLLDVGRAKDGVTREEYEKVIAGLKEMGATIARVGIYGDLVEKRAGEDRDKVEALVEHLKYLKAQGIEPLLVIWMPPGHMRTERPKTPEWRDRLVRLYVDFLVFLKREQGIDLRYFQICNEPHAQTDIFTPEFLADTCSHLIDAMQREKLSIELVGPDVFRKPEWLMPYLGAVGERVSIIAWKGHGGAGGWDYDHSGMMQRAMDVVRGNVRRPLRIWATEYATSAFGSADSDRRAEGGPADHPDYGFTIGRLTLLYLNNWVSAPLLWELCDVRRIDDPGRPKSWGAIGYKDQSWRRRSHFYTLRCIYRAMPPGSRVFASQASGGVMASATQLGRRWSVVMANPFPWQKTVVVHLPHRPWAGDAEVAWATLQQPDVSTRQEIQSGTVTVTAPPRSVLSVVAEHEPGWW